MNRLQVATKVWRQPCEHRLGREGTLRDVFLTHHVVVDFLASELHRLAVEARTGDEQRELEKGRPWAAKKCICLLSSCCAHVGLTFHQTSLPNRICFQEMHPDAADETMDPSLPSLDVLNSVGTPRGPRHKTGKSEMNTDDVEGI